MPIIPQWENNDKTIINVQFYDEWTWNEFALVRTTILNMLAHVSHYVDYIADFQNTNDIPIGALAIGRSIHKSCSHNQGIIVIVGVSPTLRILYQSLTLAYPATKSNFVLAPTLDEAHQIITEIQQNRNGN